MSDIVWRSVALPNGYVGVSYEAGLAETGAVTAVTACTVSSGSLPPGITVSADLVRLAGVPTKKGTYTFKLTMTDTAGPVQSPTMMIIVALASNDLVSDILSQSPAAQDGRKWPQ